MLFGLPPGRQLRAAGGLALAAAGLLVAGAFVNSRAVQQVAAPTEQVPRIDAAAREREQAATWVARQVKGIVGCDAPVCALLATQGVEPSRLLPLRGQEEVLNADVVVVTPALRELFGPGLEPVTATEPLATVGAIRIVQVTPQGVGTFAKALERDKRDRRDAGRELLANPRLAATPAATRQLAGGEVDARILVSLAALAASHRLYIRGFGDGGADPREVPYRTVEVSSVDGSEPTSESVSGIIRFLEAQESRFHPIEVNIARPVDAVSTILRIRYAAPSPTGSLTS
ncbi:hypothetical protein FDA94_10240 [Herbidospora galbida]|uniref:Uncharacterized protein n=1 Tax=Herbidospora galbida TaxID=2575442 RepID=A0A4U3ML87_9ACTN|nr:hypothetical protein [Herbidospora galbida]TKK89304.1 hypothetical protein FDA94_10240 [Herbidospora galbida]